MGESTKAVCSLLLIVGSIVAAIAWTADRPDATTWGFRIVTPMVALLALVVIFKLHFRRDLAHDQKQPANSLRNATSFLPNPAICNNVILTVLGE